MERYSVVEQMWQLVSPMNAVRCEFGMASLGSCIYAFGGSIGAGEKYDTVQDIWTPAEPMIEERRKFGLVAMNGCLYAVGGHPNKSSGERFDPREKRWAPIAELRSGKTVQAAASIGGRLMVIGDDMRSGTMTEFYDPVADRWEAAKKPRVPLETMVWCPWRLDSLQLTDH